MSPRGRRIPTLRENNLQAAEWWGEYNSASAGGDDARFGVGAGRRFATGGGEMDGVTESKPNAASADYLAAERTLLAWIRTGLALMGFGFVVARFGLFLQRLQAVEKTFSAQSYGLSLWFGTALIAAGVFVNLFAGWQHARLVAGWIAAVWCALVRRHRRL